MALCLNMANLSKLWKSEEEAFNKIREVWKSGAALDLFKKIIEF